MAQVPTLFVCHGDDGGPRSREDLRAATGTTKLPALKLADGTVISHSRAIVSWIGRQT